MKRMASPPTRASGPFRPTRLGQWEVVAKIAGGGMSAVYLGRRVDAAPDIPRVVALKIVRHDVRLDERMLRMFLEEGHLIAKLVHPNIVRTLEVGGDADQDFIAMELMLGKTFAAIHDAIAARDVRLNSDIAAWMAARVGDALHYAHELRDEANVPLGLVHRDVNPANVFATFDGEVKLFDFGLAKATADDPAGAQMLAGKLSYLSPEQIMQMPLDRRSDVFSLGTALWELLTSRRLFRRDSDIETVRAVQLGPIPDPRLVAPEIPEELARIVKTALERNRDHRYPTAAHFAHDLDAYLYGRTSPNDVTARLAQLVDTLFPGEQKRQQGWLKPAIGPSNRGMRAVTPGQIPPAAGSQAALFSREVTQVMPLPAPSSGRSLCGYDAVPSYIREATPREGVPLNLTARDGSPYLPHEGPPPPSAPRVAPPPATAVSRPSAPPSAPSAPPPSPRSAPPASAAPSAVARAWPLPASRTPAPPPPRSRASRPPPPALPPVTSPEDLSRTDVQAPPKPELKPMAPLVGQRPRRAPIPLPSRVAGGSVPPPPKRKPDTEPPSSDTQVDVPPAKKR